MLDGFVKYAEDMAFLLMIVDKKQIVYVDVPFIFYEYGIGISNGKMANFVRTEITNVYGKLCLWKRLPKHILYFRKDKSLKVRFVRFFIKLFYDPLSLLKRFSKTENTIVINDTSECFEKLRVLYGTAIVTNRCSNNNRE